MKASRWLTFSQKVSHLTLKLFWYGVPEFMSCFQINTTDLLFIKYRSMIVELMTIVADYYPHLSKAEALRKANNQEFPFSVFKIDQSKRAPFLVHIKDLADILDSKYLEASKDYATFHR